MVDGWKFDAAFLSFFLYLKSIYSVSVDYVSGWVKEGNKWWAGYCVEKVVWCALCFKMSSGGVAFLRRRVR